MKVYANRSPDFPLLSDVEVPRAFWRYLFAGLAMHVIKDEHVELSPDETAVWSRKYADALIAELEKGGGDAG